MQKKTRAWKQLLFFGCTLILLLGIVYALLFAYRSQRLYAYVKSQSRGWRTPAYCKDAELGWSPIPGVRSAHTFPIGPDIPMQFDDDGFRVPVGEQRKDRGRPLILALGCSFTYGDACYAEETFPHKVAGLLGGTELNAGGCSYGLAQMLLLAERLIPKYSPDYVIVQYSPWLVDRATAHFAPSYFSKAPNPFFADTHTGQVELQPPVFQRYDIDLSPWRTSERGVLEFTSFLFRAALPLFVHDDARYLLYRFRLAVGQVHEPTKNRTEVVRTVYGRIQALCSECGAIPVVVVLGYKIEPVPIPPELLETGLPVADAQALLLSSLPESTEIAYGAAYRHFRGSPPVCVDDHPNDRAHTLIAESIVDCIRSLPRQTQLHREAARKEDVLDEERPAVPRE
jgi:hypothetical protein